MIEVYKPTQHFMSDNFIILKTDIDTEPNKKLAFRFNELFWEEEMRPAAILYLNMLNAKLAKDGWSDTVQTFLRNGKGYLGHGPWEHYVDSYGEMTYLSSWPNQEEPNFHEILED